MIHFVQVIGKHGVLLPKLVGVFSHRSKVGVSAEMLANAFLPLHFRLRMKTWPRVFLGVLAAGMAVGFGGCVLRHSPAPPARFEEVSKNRPEFVTRSSRGVAVADYDNDGDDDLFMVNADSSESNRLLRNEGNLVFTDVTLQTGLQLFGQSRVVVWFDANNDGVLDLLIGQQERNIFFRGRGDGTFEIVSSGLESGQAASAFVIADYNGDQWLDVYACNFMHENNLFINLGGGQFEDRIWNSGAQIGHQLSMGAVALDYDRDEDPDIFCIYDGHQPNRLFKNLGGARFEEVAADHDLNFHGQGMSTDFADFDHNGRFDFYITNLFDNSLFMHQFDSRYIDQAKKFGANDRGMGWGVICLDYDNDTWQDVYAINQFGHSPFPNLLYRNIRGRFFTNVAKDAPLESKRDGFGGASGDFNQDGKLDLVVANDGGGGVQMFVNQERNANHYVRLTLVSKSGNKFALGARIALNVHGVTLIDEVTAGSGYASQNSYQVHFGLGRAKTAAGSIWWPGGQVQQLADLDADSHYLVVEGDPPVPFTAVGYAAALRQMVSLEPAPGWFDDVKIDTGQSIARLWNEALLEAIRNDFARPTVHARNLYHISGAIFDAWAAFQVGQPLLQAAQPAGDIPRVFRGRPVRDMKEAISYAAFRMLEHRFRDSPGGKYTLGRLRTIFSQLGYDDAQSTTDYSQGSAAALGNYLASRWIQFGLTDGSNEQQQYANQHYRPLNPAMTPTEPGNPIVVNPNRWQPLNFDQFIDQSGNLIPGHSPPFQNAEWGRVTPFALDVSDRQVRVRDGQQFVFYLDPGPPPHLDSANQMSTHFFQWGFSLVAEWSAHHDLDNGNRIDISPAARGNLQRMPTTFPDIRDYYQWENCLGNGYPVNPKTKKPYAPQWVKRGDFTRVLAEFWADGPRSETPPGHWFTILNYVADHPAFEKKWKGQGAILDETEWYVKSYLTLAGALHDAAITAWSLKGYYDYVRPISAIRYMAGLGQSTNPAWPNYHPWGMPLKKGMAELVTQDDPLVGASREHLHKIKLFAWRGPRYIREPRTELAGVGWILAENWWPYQRPTFITPPFSGYVSGHSTYSSAAAETLTLITGDPFFPGGLGEFKARRNRYLVFEEGPSTDITLQWARYKDAADQSALSRIWGGIHPPQDDLPGRALGRLVGNRAFQKADMLFTPAF